MVYPILETLRLREVVNDLRYTHADIDLGRIAELLTLNRLLAPQPLCWVQRWAGDTVLPEVLDMPVGKLDWPILAVLSDKQRGLVPAVGRRLA